MPLQQRMLREPEPLNSAGLKFTVGHCRVCLMFQRGYWVLQIGTEGVNLLKPLNLKKNKKNKIGLNNKYLPWKYVALSSVKDINKYIKCP